VRQRLLRGAAATKAKEKCAFCKKTHILFEKKEKQLCKAQKILT